MYHLYITMRATNLIDSSIQQSLQEGVQGMVGEAHNQDGTNVRLRAVTKRSVAVVSVGQEDSHKLDAHIGFPCGAHNKLVLQ